MDHSICINATRITREKKIISFINKLSTVAYFADAFTQRRQKCVFLYGITETRKKRQNESKKKPKQICTNGTINRCLPMLDNNESMKFDVLFCCCYFILAVISIKNRRCSLSRIYTHLVGKGV